MNKNRDGKIPYLCKKATATQLIVDSEPFVMLGGELHNSSSFSLTYMEPIWSRLASLGLNTVLAPVSWEIVEPKEAKFDFTIVDGLISARNISIGGVMRGFEQKLDNYRLQVQFNKLLETGKVPAAGLIIATDNDEFIVAGACFKLSFASKLEEKTNVEILTLDEGRFENGK